MVRTTKYFKIIFLLILLTRKSIYGIQVFENVNENSTQLMNNNNNNNKTENGNNISTTNNNDPINANNNNNNNNGNSNESLTNQTSITPETMNVIKASVASSSSSASTSTNSNNNNNNINKESPFIGGDVNSKLPIQYPKLVLNEDEQRHFKNEMNFLKNNKQNAQFANNNNAIMNQQITNYRKRQLFSKLKEQLQKEDNSTGSEKQSDEKHSAQSSSSSSNTLTGSNSFVPSLQIENFFDKPFQMNYRHQTPNFKPIHYENYNYQSQEGVQSSGGGSSNNNGWSSMNGVAKNPDLNQLPKEYPKFDELSKQIQREKEKELWTHHYNHNYQSVQPLPQLQTSSRDKGKFVWVPETDDQPATSRPETPLSFDLQTEVKNGTGRWKWESDDEGDPEGKIITNGPIHPTYFEQIKIYQDIKSQTHPYPFDFVGMEHGGGNQNVGEMMKDEQESSVMPTKGSLIDMLFPSKGKEISQYQKKHSPWKKILHFLTAAIPIGIIISSLTPQVLYVNTNSTGAVQSNPTTLSTLTTFTKTPQFQQQRSLENVEYDSEGRKMTNPLMDFLAILGDGSSNEKTTVCEDRIFCETAVLGSKDNAEVLNKMLWKIANETPEDRARRSGLSEIFRSIRNNRCDIYECDRFKIPEKN